MTSDTSDRLNSRSLKKYYRPLRDWLVEQNCQHKYTIGWSGSPGRRYKPCDPPLFIPPTQPSPTTQAIKAVACSNYPAHWMIVFAAVIT